jgi:hypothetical protein
MTSAIKTNDNLKNPVADHFDNMFVLCMNALLRSIGVPVKCDIHNTDIARGTASIKEKNNRSFDNASIPEIFLKPVIGQKYSPGMILDSDGLNSVLARIRPSPRLGRYPNTLPESLIREACVSGLIENEMLWLTMLDSYLMHCYVIWGYHIPIDYDSTVVRIQKKYYPALKSCYLILLHG